MARITDAMNNIQTPYQVLPSSDGDPETPVDTGVLIHVPESRKTPWDLVEDLDAFFQKIYYYHQKHGLLNIFLQDLTKIILFFFVIILGIGFLGVVSSVWMYPGDRHDSILGYLWSQLPTYLSQRTVVWTMLVPMGLVGSLLLLRALLKLHQFRDIKSFYSVALGISQLEDVTWHEVQTRLLAVQKEIQMSINKLSELDIYQRILRFENYMVALVNKEVIPYKYRVPFLGEIIYFPKSFKYNLNFMFFNGPKGFFAKNWQLKEEYKKYNQRQELARRLANHFVMMALLNFILCLPIFIWQILFFCFNYGEVLKRDPGLMSARLWSQYARLHLRHFNELDHELVARLGRAARPAQAYVALFSSALLTTILRPLAFISGALLTIVMAVSLLFDQQYFELDHNLTHIAVLAVIVGCLNKVIPREPEVRSPHTLMSLIVSNICYAPEHWRSRCHTAQVRLEFSQLFPYRIEYVLGELLSPLITPFLLFSCRHRAFDIIEFFRNFTVEVDGVGDVCSFSTMDLLRHGNPRWMCGLETKVPTDQQTQHGKAELSLMHFTMTNPNWQPPEPALHFINNLKAKVLEDTQFQSVLSLSSLDQGIRDLPGIYPGGAAPVVMDPDLYAKRPDQEGPHHPTSSGLLASLHQAGGDLPPVAPHNFTATNLAVSTLLLHQQVHPGERGLRGGSANMSLSPADLWRSPPPSGEQLPLLTPASAGTSKYGPDR